MQVTGFSILSDEDLLTYTLFKDDATELERELAQRLQLVLDEGSINGDDAGRESQSSRQTAS